MGIWDILGRRRRGRGPYHRDHRERESTRRLDLTGARGPGVGAGRPAAPATAKSPVPAGPGATAVSTRVSAGASAPSMPPRPQPAVQDSRDTEFYHGDTVELPCPGPSRVVGVLIGVSGERTGVVLPVADGENAIGRDEASDIRLPGRYIPRSFASLVHRAGAFSLRWLSDKNPPVLNGRAIGQAAEVLRDGDRLALGDSEFSFRTTFPTATADAECGTAGSDAPESRAPADSSIATDSAPASDQSG